MVFFTDARQKGRYFYYSGMRRLRQEAEKPKSTFCSGSGARKREIPPFPRRIVEKSEGRFYGFSEIC